MASNFPKSEYMLKYEKETGKSSINIVTDGVHCVGIEVWHYEYINWLHEYIRKTEIALMIACGGSDGR